MKKIKPNYKWVITITAAAFLISLVVGTVTKVFVDDVAMAVAFLILLVVIFLGIIFDVLGLAVATCTEVPFHAKLTKGQKEYKEAIFLIRNAEKVSSFCNDVVGDIAGVISGSLAGAIVINMVNTYDGLNSILMDLILTALVAAITVGGKAYGKSFAINQSQVIVEHAARTIYFIKKILPKNKTKK